MALPEASEARNLYPGVSTAGGVNLSQSQGLDTSDTEVADNRLDPGSIGPNNPRPNGASSQPFDVILT